MTAQSSGGRLTSSRPEEAAPPRVPSLTDGAATLNCASDGAPKHGAITSARAARRSWSGVPPCLTGRASGLGRFSGAIGW